MNITEAVLYEYHTDCMALLYRPLIFFNRSVRHARVIISYDIDPGPDTESKFVSCRSVADLGGWAPLILGKKRKKIAEGRIELAGQATHHHHPPPSP